MTKTKKEIERDESIAYLKQILAPGDMVQTIIRHVSRSGMQREISLVVSVVEATRHVKHPQSRIVNLDYHAARALGYRIGKHGGIVVGGCGMDMGFHLVYNLGRRMWPNGTKRPHGMRNGQPDRDGGYALKQVWL